MPKAPGLNEGVGVTVGVGVLVGVIEIVGVTVGVGVLVGVIEIVGVTVGVGTGESGKTLFTVTLLFPSKFCPLPDVHVVSDVLTFIINGLKVPVNMNERPVNGR